MANSVEKKDIDWPALTAYTQCDQLRCPLQRRDAWDEGGLTTDHSITLSGVRKHLPLLPGKFLYLKSYTTVSGDIVRRFPS